MTELEKMLQGMVYDPSDPVLMEKRLRAHKLWQQFNMTLEDEEERRSEILHALFPKLGEGTFLSSPLYVDYGEFTSFGTNCFSNFNLTILDSCPVTIGNDVFFGPGCSLLTPLHSLIAEERRQRRKEDGSLYDLEYGAPITIGDDCWIAGNVTICGGVTIGKGCVIGAGSVVIRDIPAGMLAAGNPCKPIRPITEADSMYRKQHLFHEKGCGA